MAKIKKKGIYPRQPRNKKKASKSATASTTFYYARDIQYLLHEPLLQKFRDDKALAKKISKALGRGNASDALRLERNASRPEVTGKPRINLDNIIKERYPTFVDALRDLDDALSMLYLFASLPSTLTVPPKTIARCQRLCLEFEHYLITSKSLRKSFLSIKGIYYQATIQGQDILWLVPYKFVQRVSGDVDFRIMGTFVDFYTTLLGFVNFKLYTSIGLIYPPKFNASSDERGGELGAFTLEEKSVGGLLQNHNGEVAVDSGDRDGTISKVPAAQMEAEIANLDLHEPESKEVTSNDVTNQEETTEAIDIFETPTAADADILDQPLQTDLNGSAIFTPFTFFLSRETPRQPLEFILRAFGCKRIGWDAVLGDGAFTHDENDPSITHQVIDRPLISGQENAVPDGSPPNGTSKPGMRMPGRIYIQPQWVWDCINQEKLLRTDFYAPGATLPPHLSPWAKPGNREYDPTAPLGANMKDYHNLESDDSSEEEDDTLMEGAELEPTNSIESNDLKPKLLKLDSLDEMEAGEGMDIAGSESDEGSENKKTSGDEWEGFDDPEIIESEDEAEVARSLAQQELEAEAAGLSLKVRPNSVETPSKSERKRAGEESRKRVSKKLREEEEELARQKMMMSRKKKKILEKMLYSNKAKDQEADALRAKRRKIEKGKGKAV
ncbi:MAG: mRNA-binding ribosome synthesis protein nop7 [Trizodia sp. TS-e1964]|nr:MAG: mRNA-binding ribosome synthesis protein nop7 [Trizodia sp. TS-e1964]